MKKDTIYKSIIVILLVLNALQLGMFLFPPKPPHHNIDKFADKAVKIMQLDEKQAKTFFKLVQKHKEERRRIHDLELNLARQYFESPTDSLLELISDAGTKKIAITQQHFSDIQNILKNQQIPLFKEFKKEALNGILRGGRPMTPPPGGNPPPNEKE